MGQRASRKVPSSGGFTLVELLVVIAIIGILVSLLLPAVQSAREAARRTQCVNQLKQLSLACLNHEQSVRQMPTGGWGWYWVGDPDRGTNKEQPGGWMYNVLPYMEESTVHDLPSGKTGQARKDAAAQMTMTTIPTLNCASRRPSQLYNNTVFNGAQAFNAADVKAHTRADYAINSGDNYCVGMARGPETAELAADPNYKWNDPVGLMLDSTGICTLRSEYKMAQIEDGTSKTYLVGEKYLTPDRYYDGQDGADNLSAFQGYDIDTHRWTCELPLRDTPGYSNPFRFGSAHATGWNASYCDGSVHTLTYSIDLVVHQRLSNRLDGQVVSDPQ